MAYRNLDEAASVTPEATSQSDPQKSTVRFVQELLSRSKLSSKELRAQWPTNYQFLFSGKQWPIERPVWRFAEVINFPWADVMTEVGIQTDARPKVDYIPTEPSDLQFCQILREINDQNWQKYPWLQQIAEMVLDTKWVHVAHMMSVWNPELENGLGDVEHKILDPYGCYWDPIAPDIEQCRYFIYVEPVPTEKLKSDYPELKDQFKADVEVVGQAWGGGIRISPDSDSRSFNLSSGARGRRPLQSNERFGGENMTLKIQCWIKEESVEELIEDKMTPTGEIKKEYVLKKKYPYGRYICIANNMILHDHDNGIVINNEVVPYKHGKFPIVRFVNYSYPREYAGENELTHRIGPQIISNYIWSYTLDTMKKQNNPKEVFSAPNQEVAEKSSDEPGQVLVLPDFNGYRREAGEGIPPGLTNVFDLSMKVQDKISGLPDVIRGVVDPAVSSGIMFDGYVEAAQARPRFKNRNLDQSLQRLGQLDTAYYLQFYTSQRTYRITNKQGWPEFISFSVMDQGDKQTARITRNVPTSAEGDYKMSPTQMIPIKGIPDIQIISGSSVPFQKVQQYNRAKDLFSMGAIDQKAFLDEIQFPNREEMIDRMSKAAAAMPVEPPK